MPKILRDGTGPGAPAPQRCTLDSNQLSHAQPFGLALFQANSHEKKCGQGPLRSTLRDSIACAQAVVVLDKN
jgi:hypothetical protein